MKCFKAFFIGFFRIALFLACFPLLFAAATVSIPWMLAIIGGCDEAERSMPLHFLCNGLERVLFSR